jgi:hypothetical protein
VWTQATAGSASSRQAEQAWGAQTEMLSFSRLVDCGKGATVGPSVPMMTGSAEKAPATTYGRGTGGGGATRSWSRGQGDVPDPKGERPPAGAGS